MTFYVRVLSLLWPSRLETSELQYLTVCTDLGIAAKALASFEGQLTLTRMNG